jgi:hypothetical protein
MNNTTRKHIATLTDVEIELMIKKDERRLNTMAGFKNMKDIQRSVRTRQNAYLYEKQSRMVLSTNRVQT